MKRKVLSALICTAVSVSQAAMISTVANADTTGNPSGSTPTDSSTTNSTTGVKNSTTQVAASVGDNTTSTAVSVGSTTAAANVIVDSKYTGVDGDKVDSIATYKTVKAAITSIDASNSEEKIIFVRNGIYKEKLTIDKPYVTLVGQSAEGTILTYDDGAGTIKRTEDGGDGKATYGTTGSASVTVKSSAKNFRAANITISNSYDESVSSSQAVAMKNESDKSIFVNCRFTGNQDTLYANKNKQYYYNCFISGDVDFIFGGAQAVFEKCEIKSVDRDGITPKGYIAAPSTLESDKYGYLMQECKLTSNISEDGSVYLGRPWHPSSETKSMISSVIYKNCNLGAHIATDGWHTMENSIKNADGTSTKYMSYPKDNAMYEYKNYGLGAVTTTTSAAVITTTPGAVTITNENRRQLTDNQAKDYTKENVLGGWDPTSESDKLSSYCKNPGLLIDSNENIAEKVTWTSTEFGSSTSAEYNTISPDDVNKSVTIIAGSKDGKKTGGKVTGAQDGMSYYYTVIDPSKNFELSADVKVNYFEKTNPDNQCGFGIMARDTIGPANDASISPSNMCLVGGYNGAVQSVFRNGVTKDFSEPIVMEGAHKFAGRPANDGTATYKLKLKKTNTGYIASVDNGEEVIYYRPKQLEVLESDKIYLGFFAARVASITVSNIDLKTSHVATDSAGVSEPEVVITPAIDVKSSTASGSSNYDLKLKASISGSINVKQGENEIYNGKIEKNTMLNVNSTLVSGDNNFIIKYTPDQTTNAAVIEKTHVVAFKNYGVENGDIYVSTSGTAGGKGTEEDPIDIYSAVKYTNNGQTIKVKGGTYNLTAPIVIEKGNNGGADKVKALTSYDGQRAVFNFGKKSAGFTLLGDYWKLYGIDVTNTSDKQRGLTVSGNNNVVENIKTYANGDTGLQISGSSADTIENWPSNNLILNCESYDNMDKAMNNADGFAAKISSGYNNVFRGCISHNNCDDGWDLYSKLESGKIGALTIENCIAYENGTLTNGVVTNGDGNGFKIGGEGIAVKNILKNSLAFNNNTNGITSNSNPAIIVENCISTDNKKSNIDLHYYTGANLQFSLTGNISFRTTTSGAADYAIDSVTNDGNYFYDGTKTSNKSGKEITNDYFKSVEMPTKVETDDKGNIIWTDYMTPVQSTGTGGTGTGGTGAGETGTGGTGAGETGTGGSGTGGSGTGGTETGQTTTSSSSSHHHKSKSSSSSDAASNTTTTGSTTATSTGNTTNNVINLEKVSKEQAKAIQQQVVSNVSAILGGGTQVSAAKEVQTADGNKLTVTALVKDGKAAGLVIAAEKSSAITTVQVDTSAGEVKAVYKFVPLLNKYIDVTDTIVIDKNTISLPTQANATYVAVIEKLATNNVISEGWAKVDSSWYMVDKTGNPLTGWQKDSTGWVYLSQINAAMETGWKQDDGKWYLLNNNGYMATGWVKTGDKWYYLNSDGAMASNTTVDGYTIGSDGALV